VRGWLGARRKLRRRHGRHSQHGGVREVIVLRRDDSLAGELAELRARMDDYDRAFAAMYPPPGDAARHLYLVRDGSEAS
jgi:hypothetical protein